MDLICYLQPGWRPHIRPAEPARAWMDATSDAFAYRCLPLNIANAHGWELLAPVGFSACWTGDNAPKGVVVLPDGGAKAMGVPVGLFGHGVMTFHVEGLFRTPPGWNLWVGGSPNVMKDGIAPLTGVVETDWSPFTFTMNWRFTRPDHWVRFEAGEPFAFFFPLPRGYLEEVAPRYAQLGEDPQTQAGFLAWSQAREAFQGRIQANPSKASSDHWQKHYYRGVDVMGRTHAPDHQTKLRLAGFAQGGPPPAQLTAARLPEAQVAQPVDAALLGQRDWLLEVAERRRRLAAGSRELPRRRRLSREDFLAEFAGRLQPVVLEAELGKRAALSRWSPQAINAAAQGHGVAGMPLDAAALQEELASLDRFLRRRGDYVTGQVIVAQPGAQAPPEQEIADRLIMQVTGATRLRLAPPAATGRLAQGERLERAAAYEVTLTAGEALYIPVGWWRDMQAPEFGVTVAYSDFVDDDPRR